MDQMKIGAFLKALRKEKNLTQEQLAEQLGVSNRSISRWETGNNMPDSSLLTEIAEFYDVSIPELIYGERKRETMKEDVKEVAETMSDYAKAEKETLVKSIRNMSFLGLIALILYMALGRTGFYAGNNLFRYAYGISKAIIYVTVFMFPLYTTGLLSKFRIRNTNSKYSSIPEPVRKVIWFLAMFAVAAWIRLLISKFLK
ncbi:MAG: helix-turn-helix transcriptional regulator [Oscillospiraceae bacterium]|nr:helix-turn-helix transcriptional regulator [Oscillospiraceae bacterium]